jgi:amidase
MPAHPLSFAVLKTMPTFLPTALAALALAATTFVAHAQAAEPASRAAAVANSPRLRALDFTPFAAALDALPAERTAALDELLHKATISDLQIALRAGELSATELTLYFLQRTRRFDERLRTLVELNPHALGEARAADARRKSGTPLGAMDGIPVTLKDNIETARPDAHHGRRRIAAGSCGQARRAAGGAIARRRCGDPGQGQSVGVCRRRDADAARAWVAPVRSVGRPSTRMAPRSPAGPAPGRRQARRPCLTMVSVGTETSGSLITPSSWNGVVGMKPSRGLVSGIGVMPLIKANDSAGPIGRSVTDVAVLLGAIAQVACDYTRHLQHDALDGVAVGVLADEIVADRGQHRAAAGGVGHAGRSRREPAAL